MYLIITQVRQVAHVGPPIVCTRSSPLCSVLCIVRRVDAVGGRARKGRLSNFT